MTAPQKIDHNRTERKKKRTQKMADYQPDENLVNPTRLIVVIRSSRWIFSIGKRNGRQTNLNCNITCVEN